MYIPRVFIIWLAFFLSGIAGLSYEVTWSRFLADLFGSSTLAISATISIYFLGWSSPGLVDTRDKGIMPPGRSTWDDGSGVNSPPSRRPRQSGWRERVA